MKKLLLMLALIPVLVNAQKFELTKNGFVDAENPENDYIVIPFEGKTQQDLYEMVVGATGRVFLSPKDKVTKVEYSQVNISGVVENVTNENRVLVLLYFDMYFNLSIDIKDGKIRINAPIINEIIHKAPDRIMHLYLTSEKAKLYDLYIFRQKGKSFSKKHKENIESKTNMIVSGIVSSMKKDISADW